MPATEQEKPRRESFTLIELLVVVSIIALLLSILLPSLKSAREQAKRTVCGGNLCQVARGIIMYESDLGRYPILFSPAPPPYIGLFGFYEWSYGGWDGRNSTPVNPPNPGRIPADRRPLSRYLFGRGQPLGGGELPAFRCPSDVLSLKGGKADGLSTYDDVGTSYTMNISWFWQTKRHWNPNVWQNAVERHGNEVWKRYAQRGASRFVIVAEDPPVHVLQEDPQNEIGIYRLVQLMGWHKRFSRHNLAFLDGHVAAMQMDTTKYRSAEWTFMDESLPLPAPGGS